MNTRGAFWERIQRRRRFWWSADWSRPGRQLARRLHRLRERYTWRNGDESDADWRCCEAWHRTLMSKWNSRQFARQRGCRVPDLLWSGWATDALPLGSLPACYVVKPNLGASRRGVHVMAHGIELLSGKPCSERELKSRVRAERGRLSNNLLLVEELVLSEDGEAVPPVDYKCHVFGETIAAVEVIQRVPGAKARHRFYRPDWSPFEDPMNVQLPQAEVEDPPRCLPELLACASRLGIAYGTFVRVDLYASVAGCVFGEFAPTPYNGEGYTEFANDYFDRLWQETFGDRI